MGDHHHHQSHFDSALSIYYPRLKEAYLDGVKNADDKEYAAGYFRTILFEDNPAIPSKTVFFDELRTLFDHFYKLYGYAAISPVIDHLVPIREKSRKALELIERYSEGSTDPDFFELPEYYVDLLDYGANPAEIIGQEKQALALTDQQIIELLALHSATIKLEKEFRPGIVSQEGEPESEGDRKDRFKRPQQVLAFHFLMEATGCNSNSANITDLARLLHKLIGVPEPKNIANSDLYKMLKNPTGNYDRNTLLHLRAILPYFEKLPHYPIMKMINDHIRSCDGD